MIFEPQNGKYLAKDIGRLVTYKGGIKHDALKSALSLYSSREAVHFVVRWPFFSFFF